jgi:tetratricopeptide (TPR) repeat protein
VSSGGRAFGRDDSPRAAEQARELYDRGEELLDERRLDEAALAFGRCVELAPGFWEAWYDLGLVRKWQKRWAESLESNRRAFELAPEDEAVCWNLGIAATALRDWGAARAAWRGIGLELADDDGPIRERLGMTPVRLNPEGEAEVVWCERVDPVRGLILSIPLPESGHRWGDIVLHDGEPKGERVANGRRFAVFDELERWEPSDIPTLRVEVTAATPGDAAALGELFMGRELAAEDWTESVRALCKACSEGSAPSDHEHGREPDAWRSVRDFGLAAPAPTAEELLARWAAAGAGRRYGPVEIVA